MQQIIKTVLNDESYIILKSSKHYFLSIAFLKVKYIFPMICSQTSHKSPTLLPLKKIKKNKKKKK